MKFFSSYSLGLSCSPEPFTFVSLLSLSLSLETTCLFYHFYALLSTPFFAFCFFLHFISLFLSLFVHFASLLCSFDIKSDNCASLSCHFTRCFLYFVLMIYSVWLRHSSLLTETLYSSSFSTDINASCGTDTDPSCLIRFFPSFCFSNSFFFLVISPP